MFLRIKKNKYNMYNLAHKKWTWKVTKMCKHSLNDDESAKSIEQKETSEQKK